MMDIMLMSKKDLQSELGKRGLPKSGNKAALVQRLQDGINIDDQASEDTQHANYEIIQLDIVGEHESCTPSLSVDFEDFKKYVYEEL